MSTSIDDKVRDLLNLSSGTEMSKEEWSSVRQCLRLMVKGKQVVLVQNRRKIGPPSAEKAMSADEAVRAVLRQFSETRAQRQTTIVESARKLAFTPQAYAHFYNSKKKEQ